jgi:hypothetical protein
MFKIFVFRNSEAMVDKGWLAMLGKRGLLQAAHIVQQYGIHSVTEVFELKQVDFRELENRGVKPLHLMKLKRTGKFVCRS